MKKIALSTLSAWAFLFCFPQSDSTNYQRLLNQFHQAYIYSGQTQKNFFNQLMDASNYVLRIENPLFKTVKREFAAHHRIEGDSLIHKISDSIYSAFAETYLWEDAKADLIKWKTSLSLCNEKICSCVSLKFRGATSAQNLLDAFNDCAKTMTSDALFMSRLQSELRNASIQDKQTMSQLAPRYCYQNCPVYNASMNNVLFEKVAENYFLSKRDLLFDLKQQLIRLYKENKTDSLSQLFPRFKDFEKDIKMSADAVSRADGALQDNKADQRDQTIAIKTETLYAVSPKLKITGQVTYSYKMDDDIVNVLTYKFLPYNKIPNLKSLEEELANSPPEIKIDVASPVKQ